jgi:hypothetical protein
MRAADGYTTFYVQSRITVDDFLMRAGDSYTLLRG